MEAAHAKNGALEAGFAEWTLLRLEAAERGLVAGFNCCRNFLSWNHGGNSCYRRAFQEASPAYLRPDLRVVIHKSRYLSMT
jgi:hypothetical protein